MTSDSDVDALCLDNNRVVLQNKNDNKREIENYDSGGWTPWLSLAAVISCLGSALPAGFNIGVMNNAELVMKSFLESALRERYSINLTPGQLTFCWSSIVSVFLIAGAVASLTAGYLADHFGRKGALIIGNVFGIIGGICFVVINSTQMIALFWVGRIFVGFSGGLATCLVPLYMSELAPLRLRGTVGVLCQLGITFGVLFSQILSLKIVLGNTLWYILLFAPVPLCFLALLLTLFLPESPKYLYVIKKNHLLAKEELSRLRNRDSETIQSEISAYEQEASESSSSSWTIARVLACRDLRLPLILVCLLQSGQQLSGINAVFYYSGSIFRKTGLSDDYAQYATIGTGIANVFMAIVSSQLLLYFGRRKLFLASSYLSVVCQLVLFVSLQLSEYAISTWLAVVFLISYVFTYGLGLGPIPYFIGSELFEVGPRPIAIALGSMCNWAGNFLVGMFFQFLVEIINSFTFIIFIFCIMFVAFIVDKYLPETFGKTSNEISRLMTNGRYGNYQV